MRLHPISYYQYLNVTILHPQLTVLVTFYFTGLELACMKSTEASKALYFRLYNEKQKWLTSRPFVPSTVLIWLLVVSTVRIIIRLLAPCYWNTYLRRKKTWCQNVPQIIKKIPLPKRIRRTMQKSEELLYTSFAMADYDNILVGVPEFKGGLQVMNLELTLDEINQQTYKGSSNFPSLHIFTHWTSTSCWISILCAQQYSFKSILPVLTPQLLVLLGCSVTNWFIHSCSNSPGASSQLVSVNRPEIDI